MTSTSAALPSDPLLLLPSIWEELRKSVRQFDDAWRTPTLGTVDSTGDQPVSEIRTVVLREVDEASRLLLCHTDWRSEKVQHLKQNSLAAWHFYDSDRGVQLRFKGETTVEREGDIADRLWKASSPSQRLMYHAPLPPGTGQKIPGANLPAGLTAENVSSMPDDSARENFCVLVTKVRELDWMQLATGGNLRARFVWGDDGVTGRWIAA